MQYDAINYIMFFLIYGALGFLAESVFRSIAEKKIFISRGFLTNGFCPLYGICGILIIEIFTLCELMINGALLTILSATFGSIAAVTVLEYMTGRMLDKVFHCKLWDYGKYPLNLHSYICLEFSLLWGITAIILSNFIHPLIEIFVLSISVKIQTNIAVLFLSLLFVNASYNARHMSAFNIWQNNAIQKYTLAEKRLLH